MSVKITTPTKTNFGNISPGPACIQDESSLKNMASFSNVSGILNFTVDKTGHIGSKEKVVNAAKNPLISKKSRRSSEKNYNPYSQQIKKKNFKYEKQKEKIKLPTKFLLGGNITDPLNLNSMNDEEINKALNAVTPVSSPLPTPSHRNQKVEVLIPPNINDPLNLNSGEDIDIGLISPRSICKKRKKNKRKKSGGDLNTISKEDSLSNNITEKNFCSPLALQIDTNFKTRNVADAIVSPAIPQDSPKPKKKRSASESKSHEFKDDESPIKTIDKHKFKKQVGNNVVQMPTFRPQDNKFLYGNYNRYYGKRNPGMVEDKRLKSFPMQWFEGKDVLDIGCNIGHITLTIAKRYQPKRIVGMDIDPKLISIARKNVRHYMTSQVPDASKFPVSLSSTYGPVVATFLPKNEKEISRFPDNVNFVQGNYVLDNDELLELQTEEFDVILALSVSKWIHLNFGDSGLKRVFKRMYRQLRPGGRLILEPQSKQSYKKKKKLSETIWKNFNEIKLWPEKFRAYMLSPEVGFFKCEFLDIPFNKSQGFQRPIMVFTKAETTQTTPREITESRGVTPLMNIDCGGHGFTPRFDDQSYTTTPNYDLHPSFSFSSVNMPIRGYDAFLESQVARAFTPTQELIASTGRTITPRFDIGTPSVSNQNTPNRPLHCSESEQYFSCQEPDEEQLFEQLSDNEDGLIDDIMNHSTGRLENSSLIEHPDSGLKLTSHSSTKETSLEEVSTKSYNNCKEISRPNCSNQEGEPICTYAKDQSLDNTDVKYSKDSEEDINMEPTCQASSPLLVNAENQSEKYDQDSTHFAQNSSDNTQVKDDTLSDTLCKEDE